MILALIAAAVFQPIATEAEVSTSNGKTYRVQTCFRDPQHLTAGFVYPDRDATFAIDGDAATVIASGGAPSAAGAAEKRFAIGHQFHAIYYNFAQLTTDRRGAGGGPTADSLRPGWVGDLAYGGSVTSLHSASGRLDGFRFDTPDTTAVEVRFSDWRDGGVPFRITLDHAGVRYDYRFTRIDFRC